MFSGIIEANAPIQRVEEYLGVIRIYVEKPSEFNDLNVKDSLATDGVCLTVEALEEGLIQCAIGPETLNVTGWTASSLKNRRVNLERSLRYGDRVHGHFVTGHVDTQGTIRAKENQGEATFVRCEFTKEYAKYIWRKGSITINGVSLTVNKVEGNLFEVCLIPETLQRTNLKSLQVGDAVNLEVDSFARGLVHVQSQSEASC